MKIGIWALALTCVCMAVSLQAQTAAQPAPAGQVIFKTPQEAVRYYEDLIGQLCTQVRTVQDDNARIASAVNDMQKQVQALSQTNQALAQDVAMLKKQVSVDASSRMDQLNQIKGAITAASHKAAAEDRESAKAASSTEMIEVTVPPGATLSVIAKTYKVSVADIKSANELKSDTLRAGQKLLIPKK